MDQSRKILFLATTTTAGGIDEASTRLAVELLKRGHHVVYVTAHDGAIFDHCTAYGIPTETLLSKNSGDLSGIMQVARFVRKHRPDIVQIHSRRDFVPAALGARIGGMRLKHPPKVVLHLHLHKVMGTPPKLAGWFFQRVADKAIAVSNAVRELVIQAHGLQGDFVETVYNGIQAGDYLTPGSPDYAKARRVQRASWGISDDAPVIGMLGRYNAKGQRQMIGAMPQMLLRLPNVRLVLIGADSGENQNEPSYRQSAEAQGVTDQVVVTGLSEDVPSLLPMLDLLVHLPTDEAFGLALVEAMASGIPVIASDIPGCREVIDMTQGGVTIDPTDTDALLSTIERLLGAEVGAAFAQQGRQAVDSKFAMSAQVDAIEALYGRLSL